VYRDREKARLCLLPREGERDELASSEGITNEIQEMGTLISPRMSFFTLFGGAEKLLAEFLKWRMSLVER
jgi:hypothetical protein